MLGMAAFTFLGGQFGATGRFQDGYKTVLFLIPILILAILFYPTVDKNRKAEHPAAKEESASAAQEAPAGKFPGVAVGMLLLYLFGAIFWNAWFMNYSDYIVNEAQLGTTATVSYTHLDVYKRQKLMSAQEAAQFIKTGMVVAVSGFTSVSYPKAVPEALAASGHARDLNICVGAAVGDEIDGAPVA